MDDDARARLAVAGREANDGEMETRWRCSRPGVLAVDACPELWMLGTERAMMALGLVIVSARADLLIVIPRACTSLVAGDAASPLARAIVDIGAACVRRWVMERRGGGARVGVTPVVPRSLCHRLRLFSDKTSRDFCLGIIRGKRLFTLRGATRRCIAMVHESLDPDSAEDFVVLVASRTAVALSMLASSSGAPRSSRPAPLDSAVWKDVLVQYEMIRSDGEDGKYRHVFLINSDPRVGLLTHEDVYDFVGRVFLDVVDLTQWKMKLSFLTAMKEESNLREYRWDYQSLPVGRRSRVHRPVGDLDDDSTEDEDLSEGVTFAREQVEMKETPKPQHGVVDTFEGTWITIEFYSRIQHWKVKDLSHEFVRIAKGALQGLPGGVTVAFHVPDGKEGQQVYVTESGDTETNVPKPLGAEILHANGYGTASDPRASCSINMWLHSWPVPWERSEQRDGYHHFSDVHPGCGVHVNFALVNAEQARGLVDSLWVKPIELWIEHNLANSFRRNEAEEDAPSAEMPEDEKRRLAFRVLGRRKIPAEIEEANIGDDIAAVIAGDAVNVADDSYDRYLDFPQYVHFLRDVGVHFIDDDVFARGDSDATDEPSGFRLPPKLFHTRCTHLPRQLRDKLIDRALKGALKDLKQQDRYGFISEEERGRLKVCDSVLAAATGILEAAGPDRAPEFFAQIQHTVDEQPDLDWKKAFRQKLRAIAFE
jgi:hypothetical protein